VIYLDSSVALASLLIEQRVTPESLWVEQLVSSRLLEYEVWNGVHMRQAAAMLGGQVQQLLNLIQFIDPSPTILARAIDPFPIQVRTLDSIHLATLFYVRSQGTDAELASFDRRMNAAAQALHIPLYDL
jgi:hypothetical protein